MGYLLQSAVWFSAIFVVILLRWASQMDKKVRDLERKLENQSVSLSGQRIAVQLLSKQVKEKA